MSASNLIVDQYIFAKLYSDHPPSKVRIDSISAVSDNLVTVTIFKKDGSVYDTRLVDVKNEIDIEFFDAPLDSKYYYQLVEHYNNSYDAYDIREHLTFMCPDKAMQEAAKYEAKTGSEHVVVIKRL